MPPPKSNTPYETFLFISSSLGSTLYSFNALIAYAAGSLAPEVILKRFIVSESLSTLEGSDFFIPRSKLSKIFILTALG